MIRLISIDLDGTLLDSGSKISEENREAIKYCLDRGVKVTLSTGKSMQCAGKIIRKLGLKDLQIVSGGTMVVDHNLRSILAIKIPRQSAINAICLAREHGVCFVLDTTDGLLYYDRDYPDLEHFFKSGEVTEKVEDILTGCIIDKALLFTFTVNEGHPFNDILKNAISDDIKTRRGGPYYLNVLNVEAGKVAGLKKVLELYNIDRKEVMAIGDNNNDMGTMEFVGLSVAMGNATDQIKEAADHITEDNDNSGVAKAIYRFIAP